MKWPAWVIAEHVSIMFDRESVKETTIKTHCKTQSQTHSLLHIASTECLFFLAATFIKLVRNAKESWEIQSVDTPVAFLLYRGIHADVIVYIFAHLRTSLRTEENLLGIY